MSASMPVFVVLYYCTLVAWIFTALGGMVYMLAMVGALLAEISPAFAPLLAAVVVFCATLLLVLKRWGFSVSNAVEMAVGTVLIYGANFLTDSPWLPLVLLCGLAALVRPYSDGPEPDGWGPLIEHAKAVRKAAEENRLKGRRE